MARRLPKPLIPVLVGASAALLGMLAMAPSFASVTPPVEPLDPTTATVAPTPNPDPTATPGPVVSLDEDGNLPIHVSPSKPDKLRDPTKPPSTIGSCVSCLGIDP
jgi:hypothetical protein